MGRYWTLGLFVVCTVILHAYSFEICTTGKPYYYCQSGYCCKINWQWKCTGSTYSLSDCDSFSELRTTTRAPRSDITVPVASAASSFVIICIIVALIVYCVMKSKKKTKYEGQVISTVQTPGMMPMHNMQGFQGGNHTSPLTLGVQPVMMAPVSGGKGKSKMSSGQVVKGAMNLMKAASFMEDLGE